MSRENQNPLESYSKRPFAARIPLEDGSLVRYQELIARLQNSDYGSYMESQKLRYCGEGASFEYDRKSMLEDLGPDLHPIGHQNETARWAGELLLAGSALPRAPITLDDEQASLLMFVCAMHDMGEAMHPRITEATGEVIGDIPAGRKTRQHKLVEKRVRQHIYETLLPDVETNFLRRVENIIAHEPDVNDIIVHELFEAAHGLQTFDTARRAFEHSQSYFVNIHKGDVIDIATQNGARRSGLLGLHRAVLLSNCDTLPKLASQYALIAKEIEPYLDEIERYREYKRTTA